MARQHGDVFTPLAQRRQPQANDAELVEQVLGNVPFLGQLLQVLMRRGHDAHMRVVGAVPTDAVKLTVRVHAQ